MLSNGSAPFSSWELLTLGDKYVRVHYTSVFDFKVLLSGSLETWVKSILKADVRFQLSLGSQGRPIRQCVCSPAACQPACPEQGRWHLIRWGRAAQSDFPTEKELSQPPPSRRRQLLGTTPLGFLPYETSLGSF